MTHDFYAEYKGRVFKVRSDISAGDLQYCAYSVVATCTDILTMKQTDVRCLSLNPLTPLEVLAMMKDAS